MLAVGMACVFGEELRATDDVARLLDDTRWPWRPSLLRLGVVPGQNTALVRKRRLPVAKRRALVKEALDAPTIASVGVSCSASERDNHAWAYVDTGRERVPPNACPFTALAFCRAAWLPEGVSLEPWLELVHDLVVAVGAANGVIAVADETIVQDEMFLQTTWRDDKRVNPNAREVSRESAGRHELGRRYIRLPRWGTYLAPHHVEAAGGRERIREVVQPAVMREAGPLLYVQLTASAETAGSHEAVTKRAAFVTLLAPALPPA